MQDWLLISESSSWFWEIQVGKGTDGESYTAFWGHQVEGYPKWLHIGDQFEYSAKTRQTIGELGVSKSYGHSQQNNQIDGEC